VLWRIYGLKREEVAGRLGKLHNEEIHYLYASPNIITVIKSKRIWVGYVVCMGEMRNTYKILAGKPQGRRQLGRTRHSWENNIRLVLKK
jgi:hypothetical protein